MPYFSLSWDEYNKSICNGLSNLQQNGEFVDMTLAADGHLVKVHQLVMALASPFIKQLISTANCPHPVIFLNRISYETLCALLEYIYTGEVEIDGEKLNELLDAGRELHVKGLKDMTLHTSLVTNQSHIEDLSNYPHGMETVDTEFIEGQVDKKVDKTTGDKYIESDNLNDDNSFWVHEEIPGDAVEVNKHEKTISETITAPVMQYTVSNQGRLQMILNRYMYYLKYTNKNKTQQWRCIDYLNQVKCPAYLFTKGDTVIQRISMHIHPFHDKKILKKVRSKAVFSAIHEARESCAKGMNTEDENEEKRESIYLEE